MRAHSRPILDPRVEYGFRSADPATEARNSINRCLGIYVVWPPATTQDELNRRKALPTQSLTPQEVPADVYRARLRAQRGGVSRDSSGARPRRNLCRCWSAL
ncbi:hypothetical protein Plhal703r1_c26g0108501 [Plasmopara halstedii]